MNSLNNCINYLLTGAQHTVFQYMKKNLAQFDITGLIRRMIDSTDRRYIYIELTDVSRDLEIPVRTVVTEVDRKVLEIFNGEEEAALKNALRRL